MARRKYINGIRRHPSQFKQYKSSRYGVGSSKSPMLHDSRTSHPHPHSEKYETTLFDSIYSKSKVDSSLVEMGYDPHTRQTTQSDGTVVKGRGKGGWKSKKTIVNKIPDNFQQEGKETKDSNFQRQMLAPSDYF